MWHPDDVENYSIPDNPIYGDNLPDLKDSITQNGIQRPLAIHTDGDHAVLADGHHRLMAAQELGLHEVPVQVHYGAFDFDEEDDPEADELIHEHLDQHHPGWRRGRSARSRPCLKAPRPRRLGGAEGWVEK